MAGNSNTGGGGSVEWNVEVTSLKNSGVSPLPNGNHSVSGADHDGQAGIDSFTVSIKLPAGDFDAFKSSLMKKGSRVEFLIPIEKDPNQINIRWGNSPLLPPPPPDDQRVAS